MLEAELTLGTTRLRICRTRMMPTFIIHSDESLGSSGVLSGGESEFDELVVNESCACNKGCLERVGIQKVKGWTWQEWKRELWSFLLVDMRYVSHLGTSQKSYVNPSLNWHFHINRRTSTAAHRPRPPPY